MSEWTDHLAGIWFLIQIAGAAVAVAIVVAVLLWALWAYWQDTRDRRRWKEDRDREAEAVRSGSTVFARRSDEGGGP